MGWKYGFDSPFKSEIYFVVTSQKIRSQVGYLEPIMSGTLISAWSDFALLAPMSSKSPTPRAFLRELVATDPSFEAYEIDSQLRQVIQSKFADTVGKANMPVLDLVGKL